MKMGQIFAGGEEMAAKAKPFLRIEKPVTGKAVGYEMWQEETNPGDAFLPGSDGSWEMVRDDEIQTTPQRRFSPQSACEQLIEVANENGDADNVPVIVAKVSS
jgi:serine/threonine protein phosphatase PrpC